jgi:hypothetical protein
MPSGLVTPFAYRCESLRYAGSTNQQQILEVLPMNMKKVAGFTFATAAAAMFAAAPLTANAMSHEGMVKCEGGNACKGKGECKSANNACKGQNACKGKGMNMMKKDECEKAGGKAAAAAPK